MSTTSTAGAPLVPAAAAAASLLPPDASGRDAGDHRSPGRVRSLAGWAAVLAAALVVGWFWPTSLGGCTTVVVVSGGSMEPTYAPGDLLVARCGEVAVGDVVVYEPPTVPGARVVHRVVGGDASGWELQGDANDWLDPWQPGQEHVLGRVVTHLPGLGLSGLLLDPLPWASLMVLGSGVLLWPTRRRPDEGADDAEIAVAPVAGVPSAEPAPQVVERSGRSARRSVRAHAVGAAVVMLALAGMPAPADAAATALSAPTLHTWTAPVTLAPELPAAGCTTPDPALPCTAEVRLGNVWGAGYDLYVVIRDARTNASTALVPWTVTLDFSREPFPWVPNGVDASGLLAQTTCADLPVLTMTGRTDWGTHDRLGAGDSRELWLQAHNNGVGNVLDCA